MRAAALLLPGRGHNFTRTKSLLPLRPGSQELNSHVAFCNNLPAAQTHCLGSPPASQSNGLQPETEINAFREATELCRDGSSLWGPRCPKHPAVTRRAPAGTAWPRARTGKRKNPQREEEKYLEQPV